MSALKFLRRLAMWPTRKPPPPRRALPPAQHEAWLAERTTQFGKQAHELQEVCRDTRAICESFLSARSSENPH